MSVAKRGAWGCGVVLALWVAGCAPAAPPVTSRPPVDPPDSVEAVLRRWYVAIGAQDSAGIAAPLAPEFFIFEHTKMKSRDELIRDIMAGAGQGTQSADMQDFQTVVTDSVAWTSMHNHEVWTPVKGTPMPFDFLETVVFVKRDGRWLMERYHATRVDPAPGKH
ncbi:MAG: nuclear transport factor 2 family protein [Candidatus Eisenbacteria bacterium]